MAGSTVSRLLLIVLLALTLTGCTVVAGIFKAGIWVGAVVAILIIGLIALIASKARG